MLPTPGGVCQGEKRSILWSILFPGMKKIPLVAIIATLAILAGGIFLFSKNTPSPAPLPAPTTHEYFFSPTCPHCTNVNVFIESWDKKDTFQMQKYDVSGTENSDLFLGRGKACGIRPSELGVPLLVTTEGKCLLGDEPIIEYLKNLN